MDGHETSNGPVVDRNYWLYTHLPDGDGSHFAIPDGTGSVYHYRGSVVGGPFASDVEACPAMLARGIESLPAWPPGQYSPIVDCTRFRGPTAATDATINVGSGAPDGATASGPSPAGEAPDPARLGAAAGGIALIAAGAAGLLRRGRRPAVEGSPESTSAEPVSDPCAEQAGEFEAASARAAVISDLLQTNRRLQALVDRQIVLLANVMIPGSFGVDVAFILGGQWGSKIGWGFLPKEVLGKAFDGAIKDVVKDLGKRALDGAGRAALDMDGFEARLGEAAAKGGEGGAKGLLKDMIKVEIQGHQTARVFATASGSPIQVRARLTMLKTYQDSVAGPAVDALSHVMSMYNAGIGVATLMEKLDILRMKRDAMLDATAGLEIEHETAVEDARNARERLNFCRHLNSPDWRP